MADTRRRQLCDHRGAPLAIGDQVVAVAVDDGAPQWAHAGTVVSLGRTRIGVQWTAWDYTGLARPYHTPPPTAVRKIEATAATP